MGKDSPQQRHRRSLLTKIGSSTDQCQNLLWDIDDDFVTLQVTWALFDELISGSSCPAGHRALDCCAGRLTHCAGADLRV